MIRTLRTLIMIAVLSVVSACTTLPQESNENHAVQHKEESIEFERVKVELNYPSDGDTINVIYNGEPESVRFLLVDSPETSHPRLGEQPYGQEAKEFTSQLVMNANTLELEFDIGPKRDRYDRLLAYVYADGKMIQEELLKNGLARVAYIFPPNTRYVDQFNALQEKAQQEGIGIWEVENYAQEDGFYPEVIEQANGQEDSSHTEAQEQGCDIKGNINSRGEKIFHTPDSPWYEQTKQEAWFCTEEEAIEAGFRAPKYQ
ncbi:thermonuclease family protein [Halalkalibacterium ligniniphilum]|uniref:thermonuclease family protein n=1 Tax=Halalkalibacterium ligniniphilum TaxID=1134413 RepID=UPI00035E2223|nr:thermonuclease family protein [Halalkalibacterium ligniniphilum]